MALGIYIAGVVLTLLSMASFQEGGIWVIGGVVCTFAVIGFAILSMQEIKEK